MSYMEKYGAEGLEILLGRTIAEIRMDEEYLIFTDIDGQVFGFTILAECCSHSYFYDFHNPERLLIGNPVTAVEEIELHPEDYRDGWGNEIACYGYRLTTNDETFGPVSTAFSFRNSSNGYYGGDMVRMSAEDVARLNIQEIDVITETVTEI